jgi:hypothetical protein
MAASDSASIVKNSAVRRPIFERRDEHDRDEAAERQQGRGSARPERTDPADREGEGEREQPADRGAVDHDAGEQAEARLRRAADRPFLGVIVMVAGVVGITAVWMIRVPGVRELILERDRAVDLRLAEHLGEPEREQARDGADQHAAQEQMPDHDGVGRASVAGEAEQVAAVVQELVDIHARNERCRALLGADEIEREQQHQPGEDRPRQELADRNRPDHRGDGHARQGEIGHVEVSWKVASRRRNRGGLARPS